MIKPDKNNSDLQNITKLDWKLLSEGDVSRTMWYSERVHEVVIPANTTVVLILVGTDKSVYPSSGIYRDLTINNINEILTTEEGNKNDIEFDLNVMKNIDMGRKGYRIFSDLTQIWKVQNKPMQIEKIEDTTKLPVYNNNTEAISNGKLEVGELYRNSTGQLMVVYKDTQNQGSNSEDNGINLDNKTT